jgi:hypothetical protein
MISTDKVEMQGLGQSRIPAWRYPCPVRVRALESPKTKNTEKLIQGTEAYPRVHGLFSAVYLD